MITRQQYLEALEVIDIYHRQSSDSDIEAHNKTPILEWINTLDEKPSGRLYNVLVSSFKYFEDVNKHTFLRIRNAGASSWTEFCSLANIEP